MSPSYLKNKKEITTFLLQSLRDWFDATNSLVSVKLQTRFDRYRQDTFEKGFLRNNVLKNLEKLICI